MNLDWDRLLDAPDDIYREEQYFKDAAYKLVTSQVLYETEPLQRTAYRIVMRHQEAFRAVVGLLGLELLVNDEYRYCAVIPRDIWSAPLPLEDTLLILVLRQEYHHRAVKGELEDGRAQLTIEQLLAVFRDSTGGRELPKVAGELRDVINRLKRFGMAKAVDTGGDEMEQPFHIEILPAIVELINETTAAKLNSDLRLAGPDDGEYNDEEA